MGKCVYGYIFPSENKSHGKIYIKCKIVCEERKKKR